MEFNRLATRRYLGAESSDKALCNEWYLMIFAAADLRVRCEISAKGNKRAMPEGVTTHLIVTLNLFYWWCRSARTSCSLDLSIRHWTETNSQRPASRRNRPTRQVSIRVGRVADVLPLQEETGYKAWKSRFVWAFRPAGSGPG